MATAPAGCLERTYDGWHFRISRDDEEDTDDPTQAPNKLGVFSSEQNAKAVIERSRRDARFGDFPDGFRTLSAPPDSDHWDGGFISWDDA